MYSFSCICQHKYLKIPKLSHKHLSYPGNTLQANFSHLVLSEKHFQIYTALQR